MNEDSLTPESQQPAQPLDEALQAPAEDAVMAPPEIAPADPETPTTEGAEFETAKAVTATGEAEPETAKAETSEKAETPEKPETPELSEGRRKAQAAWERLVKAKDSGETITGTVKSPVKGGALLDIDGYRGFLPASHVRVPKGTALDTLVNTTIPVKIIDVDEQRKRVVVSHRRAMEEERRSARSQLLQSLRVGEEREATVVRLADFGAFVDLGGIDALIPLGELAFERVEKASDVVHPGDKLKVRVLRIDENGKKIAVSRKGALDDPWRDHADVLRQGNVVEGTVVAKEPRLTIEIAPGVSGTLGDREADPSDYEIGEKVEVSIRNVDYRNRRIRLSTPHAAQSFTSGGFAPLGTELGR